MYTRTSYMKLQCGIQILYISTDSGYMSISEGYKQIYNANPVIILDLSS